MKNYLFKIIIYSTIAFGAKAQTINTISKRNGPLVIDKYDNLFFLDRFGLHKMESNGAIKDIAINLNSGLKNGKYMLDGLLTTDFEGNIYVLNSNSDLTHSIIKFNSKGFAKEIYRFKQWGDSIADIAADSNGNIYFHNYEAIFKLDPNGTITRIAGFGSGKFGEPLPSNQNDFKHSYGGRAIETAINPTKMAVDAEGNVFFTESSYNCVLKIGTDGIITLIAGGKKNGELWTGTNTGDDDLAIYAQLTSPVAIATGGNGDVYFSVSRIGTGGGIRKVNTSGIISTVAGLNLNKIQYSYNDLAANEKNLSKDDGISPYKAFVYARSIAVNSKGDLYFWDNGLFCIRKITFDKVAPASKITNTCPIADAISQLPQLKTDAEKEKAKDLTLRLLGALYELGKYRDDFLKDPHLIDLFPTVYYDITKKDLERISKGEFDYPIEHMQQLLAFFDAYKNNRDSWNKNKTAEEHWAKQFMASENGDKEILTFSFTPSSSEPITAHQVYVVLSSAIDAHVINDLPRAIRYSFNNRFNLLLTPGLLYYDFKRTDDTFAICADQINGDIFAAAKASKTWGKYLLYPKIVAAGDYFLTNTTKDVIKYRHNSWEKAFNKSALATKKNQPSTDDDLKTEGIKACH